jgi:predicted RNA-binding Zn-ribbon protein involved in translation (DUF1610 family)
VSRTADNEHRPLEQDPPVPVFCRKCGRLERTTAAELRAALAHWRCPSCGHGYSTERPATQKGKPGGDS